MILSRHTNSLFLDSVFREAARPVQKKKNPRSSARLIRVRGELFLVGAVAFRGVELPEDVEFVEGRKDHEDEVPVADFVSFFTLVNYSLQV
jgi:hypothetical protein